VYDNNEPKRPNRVVEFAKTGVKQAGKKLAIKAGKTAVAGLGKAAGALIAMVGAPVIIISIIVILVILFFGAYYWSAPETVMLDNIKNEQSDYDREIYQYAIDEIGRTNVIETFLVPGEGAYYPDDKGYPRIGEMVDNNGLDVKLANEWGDAYAPALWKSFLTLDDNKLEDEKWTKDEITANAEEIRPWFYYKESSVTVCSVDEEGKTHCSTYSVYLLVEAFTIRGHNLYTYEWVTETYDDGGSLSYERLKDTKNLDDGKEYLNTSLQERITDGKQLGLEDDEYDNELTLEMIWQSMQGYSAEAEWLAWLMDNGIDLLTTVSRTQIPAEYRAFLTEASELTGIPVHVLAAIIIKESSWNPLAVNDSTGCFGLTQLNPEYWEEWCRRYGFDPVEDKWNPRAQILIGAQVFKDYMGKNQPDWDAKDWHRNPMFQSALAKYGGYGDDVQSAQPYIKEIVQIAEAYKSRTSGSPVVGYGRSAISSYYGRRINPTTGESGEFHSGIDFAVPKGTEIVSVSAGVVTQAQRLTTSYGYHVFISDGVYTYIYAHMSDFVVKVGDTIMPGDTIGYVGSTGRSTGPHLHFETRVKNSAIDPLSVLDI
jgi:hypothetical protein